MLDFLEIIASCDMELVNVENWMSKWRIVSNQGQGLLSHFILFLYVLCLY